VGQLGQVLDLVGQLGQVLDLVGHQLDG